MKPRGATYVRGCMFMGGPMFWAQHTNEFINRNQIVIYQRKEFHALHNICKMWAFQETI